MHCYHPWQISIWHSCRHQILLTEAFVAKRHFSAVMENFSVFWDIMQMLSMRTRQHSLVSVSSGPRSSWNSFAYTCTDQPVLLHKLLTPGFCLWSPTALCLQGSKHHPAERQRQKHTAVEQTEKVLIHYGKKKKGWTERA